MGRALVLAYAVVCYAVFFGTFLYMIGWIQNLVVPHAIDSRAAGPLGVALAVNLALMALFGVQHTVMARPEWKARWTNLVPWPMERATYVLVSSLVLLLLFAQWRPIDGYVWNATGTALGSVLLGVFFVGVGMVLYATMLIDHFDLFGLRQGWLHFRGQAYAHKPFTTPGLYRHIRHPLYVGWFLFFWATPAMSWGHLMFAVLASGYILAAIPFEERDLLRFLGEPYRAWRERTPAFLPIGRGRKPPEPARPARAH